MEEKIAQAAARLKAAFIVFWALPFLLVVAGEVGGDWVGLWADDARLIYYVETLVILLTAACVPVSLKLFAWVMTKKIDTVTIEKALQLYVRWSLVRLLILFVPVIAGLLAYYLLMSHSAALCGLIGLTASLFCMPGEKRIRKELQIDKEENE